MNTNIESPTLLVQRLQLRIAELEAIIIELRDRLNKNSRNSSRPPSSDGLSKPPAITSLRKKSGKATGGQSGHEGKTLAQTPYPNDVIRHALQTCPDCRGCLEKQECLRLSARQVFNIPLPEVRVTEHQIEYKHCRKCKKTVHSAFPKTVEAPVQYGPNIRSWSVYYQNHFFFLYATRPLYT